MVHIYMYKAGLEYFFGYPLQRGPTQFSLATVESTKLIGFAKKISSLSNIMFNEI